MRQATATFEPTIMNNHSFPISTWRAWSIWLCAAGFYLYEYALRVAPGVMTEQLMSDFAINATALGLLAAAYHYAYVTLQIPCGVIVDRLGVRRVITISALLCVVGALFFAYSKNYAFAIVGQLLIGAGSACAFLSTLKIAADWFTPARFALLSSLTNLMGTFGATFGGHPFAVLVNNKGWRLTLVMAAGVGCIVALFSWMIIRDRPQPTMLKTKPQHALFYGLKLLIKNPQVWLIGIVGGLTYVPVAAFASLWGIPFLMQTYGIDNALASTANVMIFVGVGIGSPLVVLLSELLKRRILTLVLSTLATGIIFLVIIFVSNISLTTMFILLFTAGFFTGGQIICFACAKEATPLEISGTTMGYINALVMLSSAALLQPVLGGLLDWAWDGQVRPDGVPIYSRQAFQFALSAIPVCSLVSLILLSRIKETFGHDRR